MNKNRIYTAMMFLLAVCVIFGGWFLTKRLLIQREERFLTGTGNIAVQSEKIGFLEDSGLSAAQEQETEAEFQGREMSADMRVDVLEIWEYGGKELPHEPMSGQMDMKQAIDVGKEWVKSMAAHDVFTDKLQECDFTATKAELCTIDTPLRMRMEAAMYSYWKIWFLKDDGSVELTIHAASGEVWQAKICVETGETYDVAYDLAHLRQYAFPFMENEAETEWVDLYDPYERAEISMVKIKSRTLYAEAKQYLRQVDGEAAQTIIEFVLRANEN